MVYCVCETNVHVGLQFAAGVTDDRRQSVKKLGALCNSANQVVDQSIDHSQGDVGMD